MAGLCCWIIITHQTCSRRVNHQHPPHPHTHSHTHESHLLTTSSDTGMPASAALADSRRTSRTALLRPCCVGGPGYFASALYRTPHRCAAPAASAKASASSSTAAPRATICRVGRVMAACWQSVCAGGWGGDGGLGGVGRLFACVSIRGRFSNRVLREGRGRATQQDPVGPLPPAWHPQHPSNANSKIICPPRRHRWRCLHRVSGRGCRHTGGGAPRTQHGSCWHPGWRH